MSKTRNLWTKPKRLLKHTSQSKCAPTLSSPTWATRTMKRIMGQWPTACRWMRRFKTWTISKCPLSSWTNQFTTLMKNGNKIVNLTPTHTIWTVSTTCFTQSPLITQPNSRIYHLPGKYHQLTNYNTISKLKSGGTDTTTCLLLKWHSHLKK